MSTLTIFWVVSFITHLNSTTKPLHPNITQSLTVQSPDRIYTSPADSTSTYRTSPFPLPPSRNSNGQYCDCQQSELRQGTRTWHRRASRSVPGKENCLWSLRHARKLRKPSEDSGYRSKKLYPAQAIRQAARQWSATITASQSDRAFGLDPHFSTSSSVNICCIARTLDHGLDDALTYSDDPPTPRAGGKKRKGKKTTLLYQI